MLLALPAIATAQEQDLTRLTLEDLLQLEVTSVARKPQTLARTAAAVHVITQEDIRRSGALTIPDLLRLVPGLNVAQLDAASYAVSARGFAGKYSNKLLVLIDGRSVYTPMFGGVHWDMQNLPLAEIERIEVIRGPGGSVWGVNATNGVINIITKRASATLGTRADADVGRGDQRDVSIRHGGSLGEATHYRAYARRLERGRTVEAEGITAEDPFDAVVAGARIDFDRGVNRFALHGSAQEGRTAGVQTHFDASTLQAAPLASETSFNDANVVFSWTHTPSARSEFGVQAYYEHLFRRNVDIPGDRWHTADLDTRYRRALGRRHEVVAGAGVRRWSNQFTNGRFAMIPESEQVTTLSAFVQDDVEVIADRVSLTAGVKMEHSRHLDVGVQPTARLTVTPRPGQAIWGAASRAIRTPSRTDRGMMLPVGGEVGPGGLPIVAVVQGSAAFEPEVLHAFEAGYRLQLPRVSFDVAAFVNDYHGLQATEARTVTGWWKVIASYATLHAERDGAVGESGDGDAVGSAPEYQSHLRTYLDLPHDVEFSAMAYRVAGIPAQRVDAYTRVDLRLGWSRGALELAAGAQNLGQRGVEFVDVSHGTSVAAAPRGFGHIGVRF